MTQSINTSETQDNPQPKSYIANFERLGFGMFIHWGLYSIIGKGEWIMHMENVTKEEHIRLAENFDANEFNAEEIVKLAKAAGMKYIVLTTRHHEGYSLYDTRGLNNYDAMHSPVGRDLVAEFVIACHEQDILPFLYHTTLDWFNNLYKDDFDAYLRYLNSSIEILCTYYGKIGGFWFDGNWDKPEMDWKEDELYGIIRRLQPQAIIVNNTGIHNLGAAGHPEIDSVTFEQGAPSLINRNGQSKYVAAEMCQTMNGNWGVAYHDFSCKSVTDLIEMLCECRKVGANYLLNIGPTASGKVLKLHEASLEMIGEWVKVYGKAIYNVKPCGIKGSGKNFAVKGENGKLYFFIHNLGIDGHTNVTVDGGGIGPCSFTGVKQSLQSLKWIDNEQEISFSQNREADLFSLFATGYSYGTNYVVRVAEATLEK